MPDQTQMKRPAGAVDTMPQNAGPKKAARADASTPGGAEAAGGKPLMTIASKADQITELVAKQERGEAGQSNEGVASLIRRYLTSMSQAAQKLGDDIDQKAPDVYWDHLRNLQERIAAGDVNDRDTLALARDVVPAIREGVAKALGGDMEMEGMGEAPRVLQADSGAASMDEARRMDRRRA